MNAIDRDNDMALKAIAKAVACKARFYAYRMPGRDNYAFGAQTSGCITDKGFLIHPFAESEATPATTIACQHSAEEFLALAPESVPSEARAVADVSTAHDDYITQVRTVIDSMNDGKYDKIVWSRAIAGTHAAGFAWQEMFRSLAEADKNAFVFVLNTKETGAWIGATPETYLSACHGELRTMALAGTQPAGGDVAWGSKEVEEQMYVSMYIASKFEENNIDYKMSPTYNRVAGNVVHICNDFSSTDAKQRHIDVLRASLHPTPAVAGVPRAAAVKYILDNEPHHRSYYGGYLGPVTTENHFHFFVNLRSLQFDDTRYCIYAGGGVTKDSDPEREWQETEMKARLLLRHLQ